MTFTELAIISIAFGVSLGYLIGIMGVINPDSM